MTRDTLVLCFGEIMMRLSPKDHLRLEQATEFDVRYGGAEANTALSLAYQGDASAYVSVVPPNRFGDHQGAFLCFHRPPFYANGWRDGGKPRRIPG